jgi:hypothetical protein
VALGSRAVRFRLSSAAAASVNRVHETVRQLAFDLTRSSLSEQEQRLADLRSRSGTVLAAASIAGSFLATQNGDVDTFAALAIVAYLFCVGAAVYVLLPHALVLEFRGSVVTELDAQLGGGLDAAYEAVTEWLEQFHEENRSKLDLLVRWYTASCAALGAEVVLWTVSVTGTL